MATASILEDSLYPFREQEDTVVFDLSGIDFVDVAGIRPVLERCRRGEARIGTVSPAVRSLLQLLSSRRQPREWMFGSAARTSVFEAGA